MANWSDPRATGPRVAAAPRAADPLEGVRVPTTGAAVRDAGLRKYMLSVYNYMASGVLLSGIVALLFASSGLAGQVFGQPGILKYVIIFAPLLMVFAFGSVVNRGSTAAVAAMFWAFAAVMGLSLSAVMLIYDGAQIAQAFFATSAAFVGLSLYGYTTKKDLSGFGTFLIMGVIGLIVAMLLNLFLQSSVLNLVISGVGVLIFAGLTAYDTQRIKSLYFQVAGSDMMGKTAIMGALSLYLDFVNMFQFLLSFMGGNRD
ncbi:MAG TPA: Bax inhibitor-1/YccA family protein [Sphingomonadaceae bacterium]|nr:Bax inhibitor-1/YccA family protein [Sphingomonadaceae bacterium]